MRVTALTDDKALLMIGCEAGAYNTIDLAWVVSRTTPLTSRAVRLSLPFKTDAESRDMELTNATFDEKSRELVTLAKGRGMADAGSDPLALRWSAFSHGALCPRSQAAITGMGQTPAHAVDHTLSTLCALSTMLSTVKPKNGNSLSAGADSP